MSSRGSLTTEGSRVANRVRPRDPSVAKAPSGCQFARSSPLNSRGTKTLELEREHHLIPPRTPGRVVQPHRRLILAIGQHPRLRAPQHPPEVEQRGEQQFAEPAPAV